MKPAIALVSLLLAASLTGCGNSPTTESRPTASPATTTNSSNHSGQSPAAYAQGSKKKGDQAICIVCNIREGTTAEEAVVETLDYQGKTYTFCNESEKAEFISEPGKFVK